MESIDQGLESLLAMLHRNYSLMRDLDKSLQGVQQQNEQRCNIEIDDIKQGIMSGIITPNASNIRFSEDAVDEQRHCIRISDEKVALAMQAYDMVDLHIQQLDQYMIKVEELRQAKEAAAGAGASALNVDDSTKSGRASGSSRGGRKKKILAGKPPAPALELDLPVLPHEPTYCLCNQVSHGQMVACDNPECKIEWFHFGCVGLKEQPKGKWYCSNCVGLQRRRKAK